MAAKTPSKRPPLRAAQREFTRQLLLEVAVEVFERDGYANATIDDIVNAANATRATFYQYFTSKRDIATALLEDEVARGERMYAEFTKVVPPTRESVRAWLRRVGEWLDEYRAVVIATSSAAAQDPELYERGIAVQRHFIEEYAKLLPPDNRHPPFVRAALLEAQRETIMRWCILERRDIDERAAMDALAETWCDALGIPPERT
jgi:AcrR family transcriptional regulator